MTLGVRRIVLTVAQALALLCVYTALASAQTTATVTGLVRDAQDENVAGATVALVSERGGASLETETTGTGSFLFSNVTPDTYTIRITADGYKMLEVKQVAVAATPGDDRVMLGILNVEAASSCK
jgi:hypothetical protein